MTLSEKYEIYLEEIRKALIKLISDCLVHSEKEVEEKIYFVIEEQEREFRGTVDRRLRDTSWIDLDISRIVTVVTEEKNLYVINKTVFFEEYEMSKLKRVRNYVAHDKAKTIGYSDQIKYWNFLLKASERLNIEPITSCIKIELEGTKKRSVHEEEIKKALLNLLETKVMTPAYEKNYENEVNGTLIRDKIKHTREYLNSISNIDDVHDFYWNSLKNPSGIEAYDVIKEESGTTFEDCRKEFMEIYGETLPKKLKFI